MRSVRFWSKMASLNHVSLRDRNTDQTSILIIDDDINIQQTLAELFEKLIFVRMQELEKTQSYLASIIDSKPSLIIGYERKNINCG